MRVLVYPHAMELGGSQLNAIELAAAVRDLGHDVSVAGEDGPLAGMIERLGLERIALDPTRRRPSPAVVAELRRLCRVRRIDILHGYEWPPGVEVAMAGFPGTRAAAVCTVMSMAVAPFVPRLMPLVVGTQALQLRTGAQRPGPVHLIEPPVDVVHNAPGHPVADFRARFGLRSDGSDGVRIADIVVVGRLVKELKLEGLLTAVDVVGHLARHRAVRLIIVGDGPARATVERRAEKANALAGRNAIILTGQLHDPRPAYAAADVVIGMGGSALRALAFAKPLIVQGEQGFWELLTPQSLPLFLSQGWYGVGETGLKNALAGEAGEGGRAAADRLEGILKRILDDGTLRGALGNYGRELAVERFSLERAARLQEDIYRQAIAQRHDHGTPSQAWAAGATVTGVLRHKIRRRWQGLRGVRPSEDFNIVTLAAKPLHGR